MELASDLFNQLRWGEFMESDPSHSRDEAPTDSMRQRYEELAELAGSLAHEIKNPLSVIHMNIDLLSEDLQDVDQPMRGRTLDRVDIVRQQCERMERLLQDFMRFARLREMDLTPGNLNEQVDRVLRAYQAQADASHVEILRYLDNDLPLIMMHCDSLQAALMNLVKNAIEAMPDGGELVVRTHATPGGVALDLIDTGEGMEDATALHMFEPFYSTKGSGSGLGLPTARKIIEGHGGRITVQSELGRGTKFSLAFTALPRIA